MLYASCQHQHQEFLEAEEALLEREKRQLRAEALAVGQLMEGFKAAEGRISGEQGFFRGFFF